MLYSSILEMKTDAPLKVRLPTKLQCHVS